MIREERKAELIKSSNDKAKCWWKRFRPVFSMQEFQGGEGCIKSCLAELAPNRAVLLRASKGQRSFGEQHRIQSFPLRSSL